ncbi:putative peptidylprolyl isomerase [Helianthus annuus]|nr:putative peptidylprolyl isomerase [Helianthus annuus]
MSFCGGVSGFFYPLLMGFLPSVMVAAVMSIVSLEFEPDNALDYRNQLMNILNISEVRDVLGDGRLIKRRIRDGKGAIAVLI